MSFLADLLKWLASLLIDKMWEQAKLEDTADDADPLLETLEVTDDDCLDDDLLTRAGWLPDADASPLREVDPLA